jgi:hypothetical protein
MYKIIAVLVLAIVLSGLLGCDIYGDCTPAVNTIVTNEVISNGESQRVVGSGLAINTTIIDEGGGTIYRYRR